MSGHTPGTRVTHLSVTGPYELREVALMGFGHRDERSFDGVMRMAFCVDEEYEQQVGVEVRQTGAELVVTVHDPPGQVADLAAVAAQVARVVSIDHDGEAYARLCRSDPVLAPVYGVAPGFRPALFYSPYEAAVWSIVSARRARPQGIALRTRLADAIGVSFTLAGQRVAAVPTPSALLSLDALPGLPADRIPRLHAVAEAAQRGELAVSRIMAQDPAEATAALQRLPGIGAFYSALIMLRATGDADLLSTEEQRSRTVIRELYGLDHEPSDAELARIAEAWRPYRTWVIVMIRAMGGRST